MTFYAVELDLCPAFGWEGGPEFFTRVRMLRNGHERRNANWDQVRHHYTLPFQNILAAEIARELKGFFLAMRGQTHSFLAKDHSDFEAVDEPLGMSPAGSTPVQLVKVSTFGSATYSRTITKPLAAGFVLKKGGDTKAGTLDSLTGLFTPTTAWGTPAALTWSGEFRVPVRFASDQQLMSIDNKSGGQFVLNSSVELIEVFGE